MTKAAGSGGSPLGQISSLSLQPLADDTSALLAVGRPCFRETVVSYVVALDAKRVLDNFRGAVTVVMWPKEWKALEFRNRD